MLRIVPAEQSLRNAALTLLYSRLSRDERARQLADLLTSVERGDISLDHLLAACDGDRVVGAVLAVLRPGRMAFLWPPTAAPAESASDLGQRLLREAAQRLDAAGILYSQCLRDPADVASGATLAAAGFPHVTDMLLLARATDAITGPHSRTPESRRPPPAPVAGWSFEPFTAGQEPRFARLLERTFVESRDCPQLAGLRNGPEMLAVHREADLSGASLWRLYHRSALDAGLLLASDHTDGEVCEICYLGVVPEMRRQGLGRVMLQAALEAAEARGRSRVEVAVDASNTLALSLYQSLGFVERERLAVHLRLRPQS